MNKIRIAAIWLIFYFLPAAVYGQSLQRSIPDAKWKQLTADSAFSYRNQHELVSTPGSEGKFLFRFLNLIIHFFSSIYGHIFVGLIAVFILGFAVYKILRSGYFVSNKRKNETEPEYNEEDITITNWDTLLREAVKTEDYRLAIRYNYMWLLQLLERRGLIQYRIDKTNYDYFLELSSSKYKQLFKDLSRQYENTWYGHLPVSIADHTEYTNMLDALKKQLN